MKKIKLLLFFVSMLLVFVTTVSAYCGDRILDPSEECDDGNLINGDSCSSDCKIEKEFCKFASYAEATSENPAGSLAIYATGAPNAPKVGQCSEWSGYGYTWSPQNWNIKANLTLFYDKAVYVTNFTIYGDYGMCWSRMWLKNSATGEERIVFNGIDTQCESTHILDGSFLADVLILETCGTSWSSTDAVQLCKTPTTCGNNIIEKGEECDDGNLINGDGCSASCKIEECICNDDCNHLDKDYCNGDIITHDEGICVNYMCEVNTIIVEDCGNKIMIMNDCGRLQWGCSEELNDIRCVLINIRPDDSLCPSYCSGDIAKDGKCTALTYRCVYDEVDCNTYDNNYCCGTKIKHDDYVCDNSKCVLDSTTLVQDCDNRLYCDGQETCVDTLCLDGKLVDCSQYDLPLIGTCFNSPDDNDLTFDYFEGFESGCDEDLDRCTTGIVDLTHTCAKTICGAECEEDTDCKATDCDRLDNCTGYNYYDYQDVANTCEEGCTCTNNKCSTFIIYENNPRCTPCQIDRDCCNRTRDYCDGDQIKHDKGICVNFECQTETTIVTDCNDFNHNYCYETEIRHDDYTCEALECVLDTTTLIDDCDDGLACTGQEYCFNAECVPGTPVDCLSYNIEGIATCFNNPDKISYTLDYREGFISECVEPSGTCTVGDDTISHSCDFSCRAECEDDSDCADTECDQKDGCYGYDYLDFHDVSNGCLGYCNCEQNACKDVAVYVNDPICTPCQTDDHCNYLDDDYCIGDLIMHDEGICVDYECEKETTLVKNCNDFNNNYCYETEIRNDDYTCDAAQCILDGTSIVQECDDGIACNGQETCVDCNGQCDVICQVGKPIDCSAYNIPGIAACFYNPDNIAYTLDYRKAFTSKCVEDYPRYHCTTGDETIRHECNINLCEAECVGVRNCEDYCGGVCNKIRYYAVDCTECTCVYEMEECDIKCENGKCVGCTSDENCTSDYCDGWGGNYCKNDVIYHNRTCHNFSCVKGNCVEGGYVEEKLVEECEEEEICEDGKCIPCPHDVAIRYNYSNSYGTGIAIRPQGGDWIKDTPVKLGRNMNYEIKYFIDNKVKNTSNNIHIVLSAGNLTLTDNTSRIKVYYHPNTVVWNVSLEEGYNTMSLFVEKIDEEDCVPDDNYAEREIYIMCENGLTRKCGEEPCNGTQECVDGYWEECSSYGDDCGICCICNKDGNETYDEAQDNDCYPTICPDGGCGLYGCDDDKYAYFPHEEVENVCEDLFICTENECEAECLDEDLSTESLSFRSSGGNVIHIGEDINFGSSNIDLTGWISRALFESAIDGITSLEVTTKTDRGRVVLNIRMEIENVIIGCKEIYAIQRGTGTYYKQGVGRKRVECVAEYWLNRTTDTMNIQGNCGDISFKIDDIGNLVFV